MFAAMAQDEGPQGATLALYTLLAHLRADWGGKLIVGCGLGPLGSALALAAHVAGAACLVIEPDPASCRAAMRAGACDFFVNTVDEALRVLKNEVRQHRPLSVALEVDTAAALDELLERGVLPELFTATGRNAASTIPFAAQAFQEQGALVLDVDGMLGRVPHAIDGALELQTVMKGRALTVQVVPFETAAVLKDFDARVHALFAAGDPRRAWILAAPRLFHRDRPYRRAALVTEAEWGALR